MTTYLFQLLDHGSNVRVAEWFEAKDDAQAITRARALDLISLGIGYDLWAGNRLIFRHRRNAPLRPPGES